MDGRRGCFGDCEKFFFVCCGVFVKLFSNGSALRTFAHSVWMLALLDGDWGHDDAGETWEKFLWIRGTGFDLFCSVWNVKVCLDWNRHLDLVSSASELTLIFQLNHFVSHLNSLCNNQPQPWRETNYSTTETCFHSSCLVSRPLCCYPANRTADPAMILTACHSTDLFSFN